MKRWPLACALLAGCSLFSARGYRGPPSDHFDGSEFFNPNVPREPRNVFHLLGWLLTRDRGDWPTEPLDVEPGPPPPERVDDGTIRITFVNHATVLVQMDGVNVLTDPVWSESVGPVSWVGPERIRPPGLRFEDLPPIDLVLLSHNHYDHCDLPTLRRLMSDDTPRIAAGLGTADLLREHGVRNARDFDWWDSHPVSRRVRLMSVPVRHFSRRGVVDGNTVLWTGFVLLGPSGSVYFGGDTGFGPHFSDVGARLGPITVALLPIGAYRPRWFMHPVHIDPEQAVAAHVALRAEHSIGIHFGTFRQADDGFTEPIEDLTAAAKAAGVKTFHVLKEGVGLSIRRAAAVRAPSARSAPRRAR